MENLLPLITGGGGALIVLALWVWALATGKLHSDPEFTKLETENADLKAVNGKLTEALALERQRSNDVTQAGQVTTQLLDAFITVTTDRAGERHGGAKEIPPALDLTGKDLGL